MLLASRSSSPGSSRDEGSFCGGADALELVPVRGPGARACGECTSAPTGLAPPLADLLALSLQHGCLSVSQLGPQPVVARGPCPGHTTVGDAGPCGTGGGGGGCGGCPADGALAAPCIISGGGAPGAAPRKRSSEPDQQQGPKKPRPSEAGGGGPGASRGGGCFDDDEDGDEAQERVAPEASQATATAIAPVAGPAGRRRQGALRPLRLDFGALDPAGSTPCGAGGSPEAAPGGSGGPTSASQWMDRIEQCLSSRSRSRCRSAEGGAASAAGGSLSGSAGAARRPSSVPPPAFAWGS